MVTCAWSEAERGVRGRPQAVHMTRLSARMQGIGRLLTAAVWKSRTSSDRGEGTSGERLEQMQRSPYSLKGGRRA